MSIVSRPGVAWHGSYRVDSPSQADGWAQDRPVGWEAQGQRGRCRRTSGEAGPGRQHCTTMTEVYCFSSMDGAAR